MLSNKPESRREFLGKCAKIGVGASMLSLLTTSCARADLSPEGILREAMRDVYTNAKLAKSLLVVNNGKPTDISLMFNYLKQIFFKTNHPVPEYNVFAQIKKLAEANQAATAWYETAKKEAANIQAAPSDQKMPGTIGELREMFSSLATSASKAVNAEKSEQMAIATLSASYRAVAIGRFKN